jgi:hypothetical protein
VLTLDDKIAAAMKVEGAAFARAVRARHQCRVSVGGPTPDEAAELDKAEAAWAVAEAKFAGLLTPQSLPCEPLGNEPSRRN